MKSMGKRGECLEYNWSEGGSECSARSGPPERDLLQLTPVRACVVRGRGEPMGLPAAPLGGLVLVPLSVSVPQLRRAENEFATHFCAKVRKLPKKHGKNDNVFHCFSTWAGKERLFALFRKSAKSAKMTSRIIDFL